MNISRNYTYNVIGRRQPGRSCGDSRRRAVPGRPPALRLRLSVKGLKIRDQVLLRVQDSGIKVWSSRFRIQGLGFGDKSLGCMVEG